MNIPISRRPGSFRAARLLPLACALWCLASAVFLSAAARAAELKEGDFKQWALLAVQDEGRRKPIDTFARESLLRLTGGSFMGMAVYKDKAGRVWQPNDFLLSVLVSEPQEHDWKSEPVVLVNYQPLVKLLGLDATRKRFSYQELTGTPKLQTMAQETHALRARERDPQLSREQQEVENVSSRLLLLNRLLTGEAFVIAPPPVSAAPVPPLGTAAANLPTAGAPPVVSRGAAVSRGAWLVPPEAENAYGNARFGPTMETLRRTVQAYAGGKSYDFNTSAISLRKSLRDLNPAAYPTETLLGREYLYNHLGAFGRAAGLYALGWFCLLAAGRAAGGWRRLVGWTGVGLSVLGLALHTLGIYLRCTVAGRPPVTNMYESMLWVAYVVALLGFVFFAWYARARRTTPEKHAGEETNGYARARVYLVAALPVAALGLLLVQQLPVALPSSIEPLQPVLRDNFWLTTHVLTETASYGAFALAWAMGHVVLAFYVLNPAWARAERTLHGFLYRVLQLGVLLLAVGTILGAVWANYSWGRFWGWDPKETWAFITFLCYIVAIHGRLAGYWSYFGLAVSSVVCFGAVVMAWYGVNFVLGKGLHSYGRGVGGETYVVIWLVLDAAFLALAAWRHRQQQVLVRQQGAA